MQHNFNILKMSLTRLDCWRVIFKQSLKKSLSNSDQKTLQFKILMQVLKLHTCLDFLRCHCKTHKIRWVIYVRGAKTKIRKGASINDVLCFSWLFDSSLLPSLLKKLAAPSRASGPSSIRNKHSFLAFTSSEVIELGTWRPCKTSWIIGEVKGQLISKGLFDVIVSTKKPMKFF